MPLVEPKGLLTGDQSRRYLYSIVASEKKPFLDFLKTFPPFDLIQSVATG
jgi:hypothetical protein